MVQIRGRASPWYHWRDSSGNIKKCHVAVVMIVVLLGMVGREILNSAHVGMYEDPLGVLASFKADPDLLLPTNTEKKQNPLNVENSLGMAGNPVPGGKPPPQQNEDHHKVAGLSCGKYGGPPDEVAAEMIYWSDIPSDAAFVSPFKKVGPEVKYLTFEPDEGGWNNIRMSMETAVAMAHAMGRTLVMPPDHRMYLLGKGEEGQKNVFSFSDFFHFDSVEVEHAGVDVITFEEFLKREAMTGNLRDKRTGQPSFPPNNMTDWSGMRQYEMRPNYQWLRSVTNNPIWNFDKCMVAFYGPDPGAAGRAMGAHREALGQVDRPWLERAKEYYDNPTPVDAGPVRRLREMLGSRREVCVYDDRIQQSKVVHLMGDNASGARLLVHFYAFLHFEDWKQDLWTKRFIRDHLRYIDELQCAAARVVNAIRQKARQNGDPTGAFDTFHIRRGDFQYKDTRIPPEAIYENSRDVLVENSTIYIASDERDPRFFDVFRQHYHIYRLDDFMHLLTGLNTNYYGMLDQLIASRGRTFVGTFYSTFTGYINRIRGYHSQKDKSPGWEKGEINSYYYIPKDRKLDVRKYKAIQNPMWGREFPVAWRDIDKGIGELAAGT